MIFRAKIWGNKPRKYPAVREIHVRNLIISAGVGISILTIFLISLYCKEPGGHFSGTSPYFISQDLYYSFLLRVVPASWFEMIPHKAKTWHVQPTQKKLKKVLTTSKAHLGNQIGKNVGGSNSIWKVREKKVEEIPTQKISCFLLFWVPSSWSSCVVSWEGDRIQCLPAPYSPHPRLVFNSVRW
jgi:hypothetical protein